MNVPQTMQARAEDKKRNIESIDPARWYMEKKLDGFRLLVTSRPDIADEFTYGINGYSRALKDQMLRDRAPHIYEELATLMPSGYTVLDGEMSTADDDFKHVASVMKSLPPRARQLQEETKSLEYVIFDVLWWNGVDVRGWRQDRRRALLNVNIGEGNTGSGVRLNEMHPVSREVVLQWQADGCEGAILKNRHAPYLSGKRPLDTWLKIKAVADADVVVMGYTDGQGKYEGQIGAIKFGQHRDGELVERGQCSGMTDELRRNISDNRGQYLGHVMVIQHMGIDAGSRAGFRHPQFKGFRDDKLAADCVWD